MANLAVLVISGLYSDPQKGPEPNLAPLDWRLAGAGLYRLTMVRIVVQPLSKQLKKLDELTTLTGAMNFLLKVPNQDDQDEVAGGLDGGVGASRAASGFDWAALERALKRPREVDLVDGNG